MSSSRLKKGGGEKRKLVGIKVGEKTYWSWDVAFLTSLDSDAWSVDFSRATYQEVQDLIWSITGVFSLLVKVIYVNGQILTFEQTRLFSHFIYPFMESYVLGCVVDEESMSLTIKGQLHASFSAMRGQDAHL